MSLKQKVGQGKKGSNADKSVDEAARLAQLESAATHHNSVSPIGHNRSWLQKLTFSWSLLVKVVVIVVVFFAGLGFGDGRISLQTNRAAVATNLPNNLDYSTVNQVYQSLKANYDGKLTATQLTDGLKHGLAEATKDPYTVYFTAAEAKSFNDELNNSFSGIGAQLGQDADGNLEIIAPIDGLPADKAGVKAQDIVTSINGVSTTGESIDDAVNKIRGPKGTTVTLAIVRDKTTPLTIKITRDNIVLPSVKTKILDDSASGGPSNIGYMQISTFADDTTALTQKAADQFAAAHVNGIVLDLRDNPGGLLDAAVHLSSLWLPAGQNILDEKRGSVVTNTYPALGGDKLHGIPTVILIDSGSASASEITTGALHDNKAAYVIGEKSYGKGVVQQLINFGDGSQLKVTVASWYRPDGENINHKGITPDQTVKEPSTATPDNDAQLQAAEAYLAAHQN